MMKVKNSPNKAKEVMWDILRYIKALVDLITDSEIANAISMELFEITKSYWAEVKKYSIKYIESFDLEETIICISSENSEAFGWKGLKGDAKRESGDWVESLISKTSRSFKSKTIRKNKKKDLAE